MSDEITLEDFRASVLALWSSDDTPACQAAAEAMWAVACKYGRTPKGTVVIDVPDQSTVRSVTSYIEAMLKDQEQLSRLIAKWHDGEVTVASKRIMCLPRGTPRKPRGVLHRIEVRGGEVTATELPDDREVAITFIAAIVSAVNGKGDIAIANELASKLRPGMNAERFVEQWDEVWQRRPQPGNRFGRYHARWKRGQGCMITVDETKESESGS